MQDLPDFHKAWKNWPYKNTILLILSIAVFVYFADSEYISTIIKSIGTLGYFGAFLAGIFFVSAFTIVPAVAVIYDLARSLNPIYVALIAGLGTVVGDYAIFKFLKNRVFEELKPLFKGASKFPLIRLFKTPYFSWFIPIFGAFIIASPFPDEIGVGMMGFSKIKTWQFVLVCFVLNAIGIFLTIIIARAV